MARFTKLTFCLVLLFALATCRTFEDVVHNRGVKTIRNCSRYQTGIDWIGNDLNIRPITNLTDAPACCAECNRLYGPRVVTYIYRTDFAHCYCKHRAENRRSCPACQGGIPLRPRPAPSGSIRCSITRIYAASSRRGRLYSRDTNSPDACCELCRTWPNSGCRSWWRSNNDPRCYLNSYRG